MLEKNDGENDCLVLLTTFNGSQWVSEQIDSVLNQKNVLVTIAISDDMSTDTTLSVINRRYSSDVRVQKVLVILVLGPQGKISYV